VSSEERQREVREQGPQLAEAQKQEQASNRELLAADAERAARQRQSPDELAPLAEDDEDRPTPRR
jgi:hypothetical protein